MGPGRSVYGWGWKWARPRMRGSRVRVGGLAAPGIGEARGFLAFLFAEQRSGGHVVGDFQRGAEPSEPALTIGPFAGLVAE